MHIDLNIILSLYVIPCQNVIGCNFWSIFISEGLAGNSAKWFKTSKWFEDRATRQNSNGAMFELCGGCPLDNLTIPRCVRRQKHKPLQSDQGEAGHGYPLAPALVTSAPNPLSHLTKTAAPPWMDHTNVLIRRAKRDATQIETAIH